MSKGLKIFGPVMAAVLYSSLFLVSAGADTTVARTVNKVAQGCALGACQVGDVGPGGGHIFYVDTSRPAGSQYFEVARDGWHGSVKDPKNHWGCGTKNVANANGTAIGTGQTNTRNIVYGGCSSGWNSNEAAYVAWKYSSHGKQDWFLPSRDELNELCSWANQMPYRGTRCYGGIQGANLMPGFQDGSVGSQYWSSTQYGYSTAWAQRFDDADTTTAGQQFYENKAFKLHIRPIRSF